MKPLLPILLLLAACANAPPQTVYAPVAVDMPVPVTCKAPPFNPPPDLMAALPANASLAQFTQACSEQVLFDKGALGAFQAFLKACGE